MIRYIPVIPGFTLGQLQLPDGLLEAMDWIGTSLKVRWRISDIMVLMAASMQLIFPAMGGEGPYKIAQTFATTAGESYELKFLYGSPAFNSGLNVSVSGVSQNYYLNQQQQVRLFMGINYT